MKFFSQQASGELTLRVTLKAYLSDQTSEAKSEFNVVYLAGSE